jgi:hypothetical protein
MWQDIVIAVVDILFSVFLIPQVYYVSTGKMQMSKLTAGTTAAGLLVMAVAFATMDLTYAAATTCLTAAMWAIMFFGNSVERRRSAGLKKV